MTSATTASGAERAGRMAAGERGDRRRRPEQAVIYLLLIAGGLRSPSPSSAIPARRRRDEAIATFAGLASTFAGAVLAFPFVADRWWRDRRKSQRELEKLDRDSKSRESRVQQANLEDVERFDPRLQAVRQKITTRDRLGLILVVGGSLVAWSLNLLDGDSIRSADRVDHVGGDRVAGDKVIDARPAFVEKTVLDNAGSPTLVLKNPPEGANPLASALSPENQLGLAPVGTKVRLLGEERSTAMPFITYEKVEILSSDMKGKVGWVSQNTIRSVYEGPDL